MKWLQNNLPGVILASACGFLLFVAALLAWMGTRPVTTGAPVADELDLAMEQRARPEELEPLGRYRVITDRPVFNQTRRPVIEIDESDEPETDALENEVAEAPKVNLTGVVITPDLKLVSLTPSGGGEPLVFDEGSSMRGEYNGWTVSQILPRSAVLESSRGGKVELELLVHDEKIKEPPKVIPASPEPADGEEEDDLGEEQDDERLSRAEEIRQRIAERREQLRQQAADNRAAERENADDRETSAYASAIRNLMGQKDNDQSQDKDDDED